MIARFWDVTSGEITFGGKNIKDYPYDELLDKMSMVFQDVYLFHDTIIGEGGAALSGGERQRISIARAILKNAPVIILDEATSSAEPENEHALLKAIEALKENKTIISIAHRMTTVKNADQIIVLDKGKVAQQGSRDQLIKEDGIYKRFITVREQSVG